MLIYSDAITNLESDTKKFISTTLVSLRLSCS